MNFLERIHEKYVYSRRTRVLCENLARLIPQDTQLLDVGCGDGLLASRLMEKRPDLVIKGVDVLLRDEVHIPVEPYDGVHLPFEDSSFDGVMFVDVLHHTEDPEHLLNEGMRVVRNNIIIKDHCLNGIWASPTLRYMDDVGNVRYGVSLVYNYWSRDKWMRTFALLGMSVLEWEDRLGIYPWPASLIFERSLHFLCVLTVVKKL
jgi:SAM-dependent methyltransferase